MRGINAIQPASLRNLNEIKEEIKSLAGKNVKIEEKTINLEKLLENMKAP